MASISIDDIEEIVNGYEQAIIASDYADSIVLEMQEIEDSDYRMIWSN